jgi:anhydro-N-acetylmuramic acid kinase
MFTALSIIKSIEENYSKCDEIYICGGGAFNITLMSNLSDVADQIFSNKVVVSSTELLDFNPKSVEAGLFAWLAMSRINKHSLDYTNITGSKKPAILGNIYNPR